MTETWATFGVDLHLELSGTRIRTSLERALREAVRDGRLHPGTRLPSSRALSNDLQIARNTVAEAYGQLVAEGWLTAAQGSGTRVADRPVASTPATPAPLGSVEPVRYDLRAGFPDVSSFPRAAWMRAARRAISGAPSEAFGYGDPRGRPELRRSLADYLSRARGVRADADRIIICSGFTQALALLCRVLHTRGAGAMAVEMYGHQHHRDVVAANGLAATAVPVDALGAETTFAADVGAALLTPAHQFPLGVPLASRRRTAAVEWAATTGGLVIEDDYDGEFRYDRQAIGAMQALAPESVAYAGTASKTLAPGVRLAWLVLPSGLVDDVTSAKALADGQTGIIEQLTLAALIDTGDFDRHVRRARLTYRRRREHLVEAIRHRAPACRITGVAAGLHAVVELSQGASEQDVVAQAARRGLALQGLDEFRAGADERGPALVVGYATPPGHAFTTAVARLAATLSH